METLLFKWTVSKGKDTYGYNICSLWVNNKKLTSCNGGGYDMKGTVLGNWIAHRFKDEIVKLEIPWSVRNGKEIQEYYGLSFHNPNYDPGKAIIDGQTVAEREKTGKSIGLERYQAFHKASSKIPTEKHTVPILNGACGMSSMEHVLEALGYELRYIEENGNQSIYILVKAGGDAHES